VPKHLFPLLCLSLMMIIFSCTSKDDNFRFFAMGDMPYHVPEDYERLERVIASINAENPAFTVHVGDFKAGNHPCTDEYFENMYQYFQTFTHPLILTPGDNDWTDCHREKAGAFDPEERLQKVRKIYYKNNQSLGQPAMDLLTQNTYDGFEKYVENAIWEKNGILFSTIHVIGSNNNFKTDSAATNEEFYERDAANLFWLGEAFDQAKSKDSDGVVLFIHAGLKYNDSETNGFRNFIRKLREEAIAYEKPILLVYGDHHRFLVEKPLRGNDGRVLKNFTSMMVFGDFDMHAVEIRVDKKDKNLFQIHQHFVEGN